MLLLLLDRDRDRDREADADSERGTMHMEDSSSQALTLGLRNPGRSYSIDRSTFNVQHCGHCGILLVSIGLVHNLRWGKLVCSLIGVQS